MTLCERRTILRDVEQLGPYRILRTIAMGGMGEVFLATLRREGGFEKRVALKRALPELMCDPAFVELFEREARLAAALDHRHIVQIFDFGREAAGVWIAMEYVHGVDLKALMDRQGGPLPRGVALEVALAAGRALDYAHRATDARGVPLHIVHRDVSPQNVLLSFEGDVKLADFGLAHPTAREAEDPGCLRGKFAYMSPEQVRGQPADARSDLFSLGVILYEMLSGARAFFADDGAEAILDRVRRATPLRPLAEAAPDLPAPLQGVVERALRRDPEQRFADARAFVEALSEAAAAAGVGPGDPPLGPWLRERFPERVGNAFTAPPGLPLPENTASAVAPIAPYEPTASAVAPIAPGEPAEPALPPAAREPAAAEPAAAEPAAAPRRRRWPIALVAGAGMAAAFWWSTRDLSAPEMNVAVPDAPHGLPEAAVDVADVAASAHQPGPPHMVPGPAPAPPGDLVAAPKDLVAAPKDLVAAPKDELAFRESAIAPPERAAAAPKTPAAAPKTPAAAPKTPAAAPKTPAAAPEPTRRPPEPARRPSAERPAAEPEPPAVDSAPPEPEPPPVLVAGPAVAPPAPERPVVRPPPSLRVTTAGRVATSARREDGAYVVTDDGILLRVEGGLPAKLHVRSAGTHFIARIHTDPWGELFVDGRSLGQTPHGHVPLQPGRHQLEVRGPEDRSTRITLEVSP